MGREHVPDIILNILQCKDKIATHYHVHVSLLDSSGLATTVAYPNKATRFVTRGGYFSSHFFIYIFFFNK